MKLFTSLNSLFYGGEISYQANNPRTGKNLDISESLKKH